MGWNSWNKFAGDINEEMVRQMADAMATNGMQDAGYKYIDMDDCWEGRSATSGQHRGRPGKISVRHENAGRLRSFQRVQTRDLF